MNDNPDTEFELDMARQRADDHWRLAMKLREGLQRICAERGEDPLIAEICSPLIDLSSPHF